MSSRLELQFGTLLLSHELAYLWHLLQANELQHQGRLSEAETGHKQSSKMISFLKKRGVYQDPKTGISRVKSTGCEFIFTGPKINYTYSNNPTYRSPARFKKETLIEIASGTGSWLEVRSGFDVTAPYSQLDFLIQLLHNVLHCTKSTGQFSFSWFSTVAHQKRCVGNCTIAATSIMRYDIPEPEPIP